MVKTFAESSRAGVASRFFCFYHFFYHARAWRQFFVFIPFFPSRAGVASRFFAYIIGNGPRLCLCLAPDLSGSLLLTQEGAPGMVRALAKSSIYYSYFTTDVFPRALPRMQVHRVSCERLLESDHARRISLSWDTDALQLAARPIMINVSA